MDWKDFTMKYGGGLTKYQKRGEFKPDFRSKSQAANEQGNTGESSTVAPKMNPIAIRLIDEANAEKLKNQQPAFKQGYSKTASDIERSDYYRKQKELRDALKNLDVVTDIMQVGNFIPHPIAQGIGQVGNWLGAATDVTQAGMDYGNENYGGMGINLASAIVPTALGSASFRRNSKYLRPGQVLYPFSPQGLNPKLGINAARTDYLEPFNMVKRMTKNNLMANRALLGTLGVETAYDAGAFNNNTRLGLPINMQQPKTTYQGGGPIIDLKLPQFGEDKPRPFFEMSGAGTGSQYDMFSHSYVPLGKNLGISADLMGFKEGDWRGGRYGISGNINIPINRGERRTRPDVKDLPIYQKRGELTFNDSLRHQAGKILSYEQLRGGPGGIPLPQYGDPKYLNMLMNDVYPEVKKIMPNATAMEAGEAMDFIFNAGWDKENKKILKDPRAYALQEYYRQYDKSKLDKEGNWPGRKQPVTNELYSSTIGKLPENQRRILMNRGRDWYYQNTNNPAPGVPNPNYQATWYGRIWNTNDFLPFNPNNPRFTPTKQYGGDELDNYQYGGGFLPTRYTSNPYDPAIKNFNDSLNLYKGYVMQDYLMGPKNERISPGTRISWTPAELKKDRTKKWNPILKQKIADDFQNQEEMFASDFVNENNKKLVRYYKSLGFTDDNIMYHTSADLVHPTIRAIGTYMDGSALSPIYKKPVQPVKYADPKVVEKQKILKDAGLYTGELDGIWGSGSEKAWKKYMELNTIPTTTNTSNTISETQVIPSTPRFNIQGIIADQYVPDAKDQTSREYRYRINTDKGFDIIKSKKDFEEWKQRNAAEYQPYYQRSTNAPIDYNKGRIQEYLETPTLTYTGDGTRRSGGESNIFNWNNLNQWFKNGGESDFVNNIYSDYMDGIYDGTPLEENAKKVYDKLNNMYYRLAKESGMTPPNYIMTNVIKKALNPS